MELLLLGLAAMFCSPLLDKKEPQETEKPKGGEERVIVIVIDEKTKVQEKK